MSIGIGAFAKMVLEDDNTVMYEYGNYNLNDDRFRNKELIKDGLITIQKECFLEPEIHEKIKKMSIGRKKKIIKRVPVNVDCSKYFQKGKIKIEICSNTWHFAGTEKDTDILAFVLVSKILREYQEDSIIPGYVSYNV